MSPRSLPPPAACASGAGPASSSPRCCATRSNSPGRRAAPACACSTRPRRPALFQAFFAEAGGRRRERRVPQRLPMPNVEDPTAYLLDHERSGGRWFGRQPACALAAPRLRRRPHRGVAAGVVLAGVSAGSICWHVGGTTDSFGPDLRPVTDGLAFVPYSNGVHYDSESQRRPLYQRLIGEGALPDGFATDDGAASSTARSQWSKR